MGTTHLKIKTASEYAKALDELLSFIHQSGVEGHVLFQKLNLMRHIEEYETANTINPEKRIYHLLEKRYAELGQPKKTAIITDIHGNYEGFLAVLDDVKANGCDRIICLGDLVDGGGGDEEVVRSIRDNNILCVRGNHDQYNDLALPRDVKDFLRNLPEEISESDIVYTHVSPRPKKVKVKDEIEAWNALDDSDYRLSFVGHCHKPLIFGEQCESPCIAREHHFEHNQPFKFNEGDRYIICVGSIGYNRDGFKKLRYGIYDHLDDSIEIRVVDGELLE